MNRSYRLYLLLPAYPSTASSTANGETSARRKSDHHVPLVGIGQQSIPSVTYDMELGSHPLPG